MSQDAKPPPRHRRAIASLKDAFFPAAFREMVQGEWEAAKRIWREVEAELEAEDPSYHALMEQWRFADEIGRGGGTGSLIGDIRRVWELGKPRQKPPSDPSNG